TERHAHLLAAVAIAAVEVRRGAEGHDLDLLGADAREPAGDADVPEFVDDQREDAAESAHDRHGRQGTRPGDTTETEEDQRKDSNGDEGPARHDDRDRQLGEHETALWRYLVWGKPKHGNCIDTAPSFLEISALFLTVTGLRTSI